MSLQTMELAFGIVVAVAVLVVIAFAVMSRRATSDPRPAPVSQQWVAEAKVETGERPSAPVSEEIEELTRAELTAYPDLARVKLDFANAADGSLEIWVDQVHYHSVDEVPDDRLRRAIQQAVQEWNARKGG